MQKIINISGMTCEACEYKVSHLFSGIEGVKSVSVNRLENRAVLDLEKSISEKVFKEILKPFPKYQILNEIIEQKQELVEEKTWLETYKPLLIIFGFISGVAFLTSFHTNIYAFEHFSIKMYLHNFMTGFFLVFAFFKLLNIKEFAESFAMYDILAMKMPIYGKIYPFIELALGILCLVHFQPKFVYFADIFIMGFGAIGVIQSVLNKRKIKCACLGSVFNLPMSTVTIIEDILMVLIGIILLLL